MTDRKVDFYQNLTEVPYIILTVPRKFDPIIRDRPRVTQGHPDNAVSAKCVFSIYRPT